MSESTTLPESEKQLATTPSNHQIAESSKAKKKTTKNKDSAKSENPNPNEEVETILPETIALKTPKAHAKRLAAAQKLSEELKALQAFLMVLLMNYSGRITGKLGELIHKLGSSETECNDLPSAKAISQLVKRVHNVQSKPHKGKLKDLAQFEKLLQNLADKIL